ncbi:MAG: methionyl-tRNA formyltransferase [Clostridia bacterium]|nr:methionyl-tRNA formyltransferase [Clostridia bacterium]
MRIVFFGTPDFAVPSLRAANDSGHDIVAVVTQPDKERDRRKVSYSPIKQAALDMGLRVLQFDKVSRDGVEQLKALNADLFVTCAFGQILSQAILDIPPLGTINVHGSLLPKYRGAAPIQRAVINGEKYTGITIMRTALQVDSGDILLNSVMEIGERETAGQLFDRMAVEGGIALKKALDLIAEGKAVYTPQDESKATFCPMLKKDDGKLDFTLDAKSLDNLIRGVTPWPSAYTFVDGKRLKILSARYREYNGAGECGEIIAVGDDIIIKCAQDALSIEEVQLEGGKRQDIFSFMRGHDIVGKVLQ